MKFVMVCSLVSALSCGIGTYVYGADGATATATSGASAPAAAAPAPAAPAPAAPAATGTAPAAQPSGDPEKDKMIAANNTQVAAAEKLLSQSDEESAKAEGTRDAAKALRLKISAAQAYMKIAQTAKANATRLKEDERPAFLDQCDKPNRDKAISMFLELAGAAKEKKSYSTATTYYKNVLTLDPKNTAATDGLKAIADEKKAAAATPAAGAPAPGGNTGGWKSMTPMPQHSDWKPMW